jgi:hypothetical protein
VTNNENLTVKGKSVQRMINLTEKKNIDMEKRSVTSEQKIITM